MNKQPCIIQYGCGEHYNGMIDDHVDRHAAYCHRHGYELVMSKNPYMENGYHFWFRVPDIIERLKSGTWSHLIVLDSDVIIVDQDKALTDALPPWAWLGMCIHPYPMPTESWHLNAGAMYIRCCDEAIAFFEAVWARKDERPLQHGWVDQTVIQDTLLSDPKWQQGFVILSHRWNANLHDNPTVAPIIAAFHGYHDGEKRRANMKAYAACHPSAKAETIIEQIEAIGVAA